MMSTNGHRIAIRIKARAIVLGIGGLLACTAPIAGQTAKKPAPAKPAAAPAKPAAAAHPAAAGGAAAVTHPGATAAHPGVTMANHGITTATAHGPTATSAHPGPSAAMAGGRAPVAGGAGARPGMAAPHSALAGPAPRGSREIHGPNGDVRMRPGGRPMDVHDARRGMDIHHNLGGGRRVLVAGPDGRRMYYERGRPGYIGRPFMAHGHEFERRTYYYHGRAYDRFYRPYMYHGLALDVYAPARYYPVGFYGWAYAPWARPVPYAWGFAGSPWYGAYGAYFTPYPAYAAPSLWLTDYMISQTLAAEYQARVDAGQPAGAAYAGPPLSPEVKQMVSNEVQGQIALENAEAQQNAQQQVADPASSGIARLLSDGQPHVFVAGKEVDVVDSSGTECAVTDGDVLQLSTPPGPQDTTANVMVLASKGMQDCPRSATVSIALDELQDMNNQMHEKVDQGLGELQAKQGQGGLPAAPPSALQPPVNALVAENVPPPDPNGDKDLAQQGAAAETAEGEVLGQAAGANPQPAADTGIAPATATVSISPGQSLDQVKGQVGTPTRVVNLGAKTIYFYKDMKVTFTNGKVTNIE